VEKPLISFSEGSSDVEKRLLSLERELLLLKSRVRKLEEALKEYLKEEEPEEALLTTLDVSNPRVVEIVLDWVNFMLSKVGEEELPVLLDYYRSIGWISREVAEMLLRYARGIRVESYRGYMTPEDHVKSLEYINRIREAMGR